MKKTAFYWVFYMVWLMFKPVSAQKPAWQVAHLPVGAASCQGRAMAVQNFGGAPLTRIAVAGSLETDLVRPYLAEFDQNAQFIRGVTAPVPKGYSGTVQGLVAYPAELEPPYVHTMNQYGYLACGSCTDSNGVSSMFLWKIPSDTTLTRQTFRIFPNGGYNQSLKSCVCYQPDTMKYGIVACGYGQDSLTGKNEVLVAWFTTDFSEYRTQLYPLGSNAYAQSMVIDQLSLRAGTSPSVVVSGDVTEKGVINTFLLNLSPKGEVLFQNTIGGNHEFGNQALVQLHNGDYLACGEGHPQPGMQFDNTLSCTDRFGNTLFHGYTGSSGADAYFDICFPENYPGGNCFAASGYYSSPDSLNQYKVALRFIDSVGSPLPYYNTNWPEVPGIGYKLQFSTGYSGTSLYVAGITFAAETRMLLQRINLPSVQPNCINLKQSHNKLSFSTCATGFNANLSGTITLTDILGRNVYTSPLITPGYELELSPVPGVYFAQVSTTESSYRQKVVFF